MGCPGNLPASGLAGVVGRLLNPKAANACTRFQDIGYKYAQLQSCDFAPSLLGGASVALVACAKSWSEKEGTTR